MKTNKFSRFHLLLMLSFILQLLFISCSNDDDMEEVLIKPTLDNIEIGLNNNGIGVVGRDFHFNAEIVAGDKIEDVQIMIQQKSDRNYEREWSHEIIWTDYIGLKNTTIHKHFDLPADAVEGEYDFLITINDQNGTKLEEERSITIYLPENLPTDPELSIFNSYKNGGMFYWRGEFAESNQLAENDTLTTQATISGIKGDGIMYLLLINKDLGHRPETVEDIDFSKAIVYDTYEHEGLTDFGDFSNSVFDIETFTSIRDFPNLEIGAEFDNNSPEPGKIEGDKSWESGTYFYGVVYENTTYHMSLFHYIELELKF